MYRARKDIRRGRGGGAGGRAGLYSVTTSSELEQGSLVNPSVCDHGKQSRLNSCAGRTGAGFPDGSTGLWNQQFRC